MSTHSRKINFALLAIFEEQQAKRVWLHSPKIDFNSWVFPNPFLNETLMSLYLISKRNLCFCCANFSFVTITERIKELLK